MYKVVLGLWGFEVWRNDVYVHTFASCEGAERFVFAQNRALCDVTATKRSDKNKHSGKC